MAKKKKKKKKKSAPTSPTSIQKKAVSPAPPKEEAPAKTKPNPLKAAKKPKNPAKLISGLLITALLLSTLVFIFAFGADNVQEQINQVPQNYLVIFAILPLVAFVSLALVIAKLVYQLILPFSLPHELTEADNPAVGVCLGGLLLGLGLALVGSLSGIVGSSSDIFLDLKAALYSGSFGFVISLPLLILSAFINDKLILHRFSIIKEVKEDRNLGTAAVCAGSFIATGLILMSSFIGDGEGQSLSDLTLSIISSFFLGQLIFIVGGALFQAATSYDFHHEIEKKDNASAGLVFGSFLVASGSVVSASIAGVSLVGNSDVYTLMSKLSVSATAGLVGMLTLLGMGILTSKLIFSKASFDDEVCQENTAVAFVISSVYLSIGFLTQALLHVKWA